MKTQDTRAEGILASTELIREANDATDASARWRGFAIAFALLFISMTLWALASPLMSVPDEPAHAIRAAAVVRGQLAEQPLEADPSLARADVPNYIAQTSAMPCFAFHPEQSANCGFVSRGDPNTIVTTGTSAGLNNPVYYAIVGLPTLVLSGDAALYAMRIVNAILCSAALAAMFMQLVQLKRRLWSLTGAFVAVTPMVLFLGGAINPNGVEISAAAALFATLIVMTREPVVPRLLWERATVIVLATALLIGTRSISLLWVLVIVATSLFFAERRVLQRLVRAPAAWTAVGLAAAICFGALLWFAEPPALTPGPPLGAGSSPFGAALTMLISTFDFSAGYVGFFGWVDTLSPTFSAIVWGAAIVALIVAALLFGSRRSRLAVLSLGTVMLVVPPIVQAALVTQNGYIWQGRYMLPIFVCLLVACGVAIDSGHAVTPSTTMSTRMRRLLQAGFALLAIAHVTSFWWTLRRYVVGTDASLKEMVAQASWQPPLGWLALTVLLAIAVGSAAYVTYRAALRESPAALGKPAESTY
jgi:hypothetical protein